MPGKSNGIKYMYVKYVCTYSNCVSTFYILYFIRMYEHVGKLHLHERDFLFISGMYVCMYLLGF